MSTGCRMWLRTVSVTILFVSGTATELRAQVTSGRPRIAAVRVGIADHYKVGHWTPIEVEASGLDGTIENPRIDITVIDSDGVETTSTATFPESSAVASHRTAIAYTKVGRMGAPIRVLLADGDKQLHTQTVLAATVSQSASAPIELSPTSELVVALSATPFGLERAFGDRDTEENGAARRTVLLNAVSRLPVAAIGYDAVDVLVISAGDGALCRELANDEERFAALLRWVELGESSLSCAAAKTQIVCWAREVRLLVCCRESSSM